MGEKERTVNGCKSVLKCINVHTSTTINFGMWPKKKKKKLYVLTEMCTANDATKHSVIYKQLGTEESS